MERLPVALAWLHAEFAEHGGGATEVGGAQGGAAKTGETATPSRYDVLAMSLLPRLRRALPPNARAAVQVLLDVPKLMSEWLSKLIELEGEEMWRPGLAAYRELATQRDALGPACLRALLQVATSAGESAGEAERRAHAVKIVTAQLLPLPRFASLIGGFAEAQLRRLVGASTAAHPTASCVGDGMDVSSDGELAEDSWAIKSHQEGEENEDILTAHVQLYLAVVAKEPARLWPLLAHFGGASAGAQAVLVRNAPLLVPHIDPVELASLLVRAMREIRPLDPSAPLILALLTAVAAGSPTGSPPAPPAPPAALVEGTLELCCTELRDGRYAVPLLPFAPRPLVESVLPRLLGMAPETASTALAALMHAKPPPLPPAHLLLLLHQLPSDGSAGVSLKQLIDGVQACLAEKSVFTMQVVADALQLIVHLDPLPLIFMRTTIQALLYHPLLAQFTMGLLHHLISRQIWTSPRLWTGFVKCCQQGMPHSLPVMLALPAPQLLEIIEQQPELRPMLISYGAMHLSEVDDDVKEALGLTEEEEVLDI
jgi:symplekin